MCNPSLTKDDYSLVEDDWIAECQSLQPDRSLRFCSSGSSWDALCVLYLLSHLTTWYWITDDAHRVLAQKAYIANYEGEWEAVQVFLERYPQTPKEFYNIFLEFRAPEEFFGNLVPRAVKLLNGIRHKKRDPHGPVKRAQRHRGYRDKGTLRPSHRPPVIPPTDDRVDRRLNIGHPLLNDDG